MRETLQLFSECTVVLTDVSTMAVVMVLMVVVGVVVITLYHCQHSLDTLYH